LWNYSILAAVLSSQSVVMWVVGGVSEVIWEINKYKVRCGGEVEVQTWMLQNWQVGQGSDR
jgi:hypothetical protein